MYVFLIDIPFKGSQSLLNMRSKVTAVSYLHSGVIDTAVPCAAKSDFLIKNSVSNYSRHHCATNFVDYLREFEAIIAKAF
jgi:hypothetical protein